MTPEQAKMLADDIRHVTARVGSGRNRRFANAVDLSPEGVAKWRRDMGLDPASPEEIRAATEAGYDRYAKGGN